ATGEPLYRRIAEETLDYVRREMTHPAGGFYSAQDADSEGVEGKFFVWSADEIRAVLGEPEEVAGTLGMTVDELTAAIGRARALLHAAREPRVHPALDDKVLASWNG